MAVREKLRGPIILLLCVICIIGSCYTFPGGSCAVLHLLKILIAKVALHFYVFLKSDCASCVALLLRIFALSGAAFQYIVKKCPPL